MSLIEALYIYDEHNTPILEHVWIGRPPSVKTVLSQYLATPAPRPFVLYLPETNPPSALFSITHGRLLFLSPCSKEIDPLLILEFLHRVGDILEDALGAPLVASKIENSYDVVALLLGETCDAGIIDKTEPNALRDVVDVPSRMTKFLDSVGLPGGPPISTSSPMPSLSSLNTKSQDLPTIPWRKSNVYHTSNELYVDMIETIHVITAPSGRAISARAHGTIAMNCKVSGVPDLLLLLGGNSSMQHTMQLPIFHPCVRLAHWREHPGELSFVPPDGKFVLASYEVDLLGKDALDRSLTDPKASSNLNLPANLDVRTGLGDDGADIEVRVNVNRGFSSKTGASNGAPSAFTSRALGGTSALPLLEDIIVSVPIPPGVKNLADIRTTRGEATYSPGDGSLEWRIASKDSSTFASAPLTLRCTVLGSHKDDDFEASKHSDETLTNTWDYDETAPYRATKEKASTVTSEVMEDKSARKIKRNALLVPTSATISFGIKGWLASEIKVKKLVIDARRSRGLGRGVEPSKGVKYLTVSRKGVEVRC